MTHLHRRSFLGWIAALFFAPKPNLSILVRDQNNVILTGVPICSGTVVWWDAAQYADPSDDPNAEIVTIRTNQDGSMTVKRNA